ncbi:MAG: aminoacetone oxidase family FAD-binding enzyme, partial [Desulfobacterales bacterium]|nr:aminoacetone oxidase family FAD-binding enzyme [Desulfobacterales bacterium]
DHGVNYVFKKAVEEILLSENKVTGVKLKDGTMIKADRVILATGGSSYPGTGSSGDGYKMARKIGHSITSLYPSLVPLVSVESWVPELQGLSLKNVTLAFRQRDKLISKEFGEMLFTDYGISGPIVLSQSRKLVPLLQNGPIQATLDLKPALDLQKLENRIQRDFAKFNKKDFKNSLGNLIPRLLIPIILRLSEIPGEKKVHQITIQERRRLIDLLKNLTFTISSHRGFNEAIVTRGGVTVKEIDPGTMESKKISGLFFAGEVIDIDAYTGGYNLQAAFSTGYLAGISAAES